MIALRSHRPRRPNSDQIHRRLSHQVPVIFQPRWGPQMRRAREFQWTELPGLTSSKFCTSLRGPQEPPTLPFSSNLTRIICKCRSLSTKWTSSGKPQAHNLCDQKVWDRIFSDIQRGRYLYVIMAPPCSTFSRARHEPPGPKPLRTSEWPRGFPWLAKSDHDEVTLANVLIDRVLQVATEQARQGHFFIIEHPEQLGISQGLVPASIWDWPEMRALVSEAQAGTFALHQCQFGSATQTNQVRHECARSHLLAGTALGLASARASLRICRPVTTSLPQRTS